MAVPTSFVSPIWYEGEGAYERARRDHDTRLVPTFIYFFTDWCPHCRRFERDLLNAPEVERYLRDQTVKVRVNPEQSADQQDLAQRLGVRGFPTLLLLLDGEDARRISKSVERDGEAILRSPEEFVAQIEHAQAGWLDARLRHARDLRQSGDAAGALVQIDVVLAVRPHLLAAHVERALAHEQAQSLEDALDDLRRAHGLDAQQAVVYQTLDHLLSRQQRWDEIAACWTRLLEQQPGNAWALLARGGAFAHKGDRVRAVADAREACRLGEPRACELVTRLGS